MTQFQCILACCLLAMHFTNGFLGSSPRIVGQDRLLLPTLPDEKQMHAKGKWLSEELGKKVLAAGFAGFAFFAPLTPCIPEGKFTEVSIHRSFFTPLPANAAEEDKTLIDEVDYYVRKYYVDRTFNSRGEDWWGKQVAKANKEAAGQPKEEFKMARELLKGLGDKYTRLLPTDLYQRLTKYDMVGVGALLGPGPAQDGGADGPTVYLQIGAPPIAGSPAALAGLQKGDIVVSINGASTKKMNAFDVIELTSNDRSPTIRFEVRKPDQATSKEYVLDRKFEQIVNPVFYFLEKEKDGSSVGYIKLKEFNSLAKQSVKDALVDLESKGADRYVLDLRGNGGGAFQGAIGISGLFMKEQPIVSIVDGYGGRESFKTLPDQVVTDKPLVLWVDGGSASASEVLSGALHDNCRAALVGSRSFGKGLIQAVYGLNDGSGLVMTVARYETPRGTDINKIGIQPDLYIKSSALESIPGFDSRPDLGKLDFNKIFAAEREQFCAADSSATGSSKRGAGGIEMVQQAERLNF